ncbi:hypothetical protein TIFTF001_027511 [Ficus carica]|uniref:Uncharacterized protein n=1 Tax=Ficus carica TaxID=3494 RepID=A0AA88DN46_FICCA|nr:hypothetical protein TIFTF001_027511 [Ficus carica]
MVVCTRVGVGLSSITCVFRLNYSDAKEARQRVSSAHNLCRTTRQMGLDFRRSQAWRDMDVIGLYAQLYLAPVQVLESSSINSISPPLLSAPHGGSPTSLYEALFPPTIGRKELEDQEKPRHSEVECHPMAPKC